MSSDRPPHLCAIGGGRADQVSGSMQANLLPAAAGPAVCEREVERRSAHAAGQSKASERGHMSRCCCRSRCSAGPTASLKLVRPTWTCAVGQTAAHNLGRVGVGYGRDVCCRQRSGFEDKRGHPVCARRSEILGRLEMASCTARRGAPTRSRGLD